MQGWGRASCTSYTTGVLSFTFQNLHRSDQTSRLDTAQTAAASQTPPSVVQCSLLRLYGLWQLMPAAQQSELYFRPHMNLSELQVINNHSLNCHCSISSAGCGASGGQFLQSSTQYPLTELFTSYTCTGKYRIQLFCHDMTWHEAHNVSVSAESVSDF